MANRVRWSSILGLGLTERTTANVASIGWGYSPMMCHAAMPSVSSDGDGDGEDGDGGAEEIDILYFVAQLGEEDAVAAAEEPSDTDDIDISRKCDCGCGIPYIRPRTHKYFKAHLDRPLWTLRDPAQPGKALFACEWTLRQTVNALLGHIRIHGPRREELESMLRLYSNALPGTHHCPESLYMLIRLTGAPNWKEYEYHVCSSATCTGHLYSRRGEGEDACPKCEGRRYKEVQVGGKRDA
jgi:hypothetical protein